MIYNCTHTYSSPQSPLFQSDMSYMAGMPGGWHNGMSPASCSVQWGTKTRVSAHDLKGERVPYGREYFMRYVLQKALRVINSTLHWAWKQIGSHFACTIFFLSAIIKPDWKVRSYRLLAVKPLVTLFLSSRALWATVTFGRFYNTKDTLIIPPTEQRKHIRGKTFYEVPMHILYSFKLTTIP